MMKSGDSVSNYSQASVYLKDIRVLNKVDWIDYLSFDVSTQVGGTGAFRFLEHTGHDVTVLYY